MRLSPKMVWFDLDDTLFDHSYSVALGLERIQEKYPVFASQARAELVVFYNQAINAVYIDFLKGSIDFPEMRLRKLHHFCRFAKIAEAEIPETTIFHQIYDEGYMSERRATTGSRKAVQRLCDQGIDVAVLTNGLRKTQEEKMRTIGFEFLIPSLLASEQSGAAKPDPRIFQWALRQTNRQENDVIMVGDNLVNDIEGAVGAGIRAIYYCPSSREKTITVLSERVPVITDWEQLPDLLQEDSADLVRTT